MHEKGGINLWVDVESFRAESMIPDDVHVIPVFHNTIIHRIADIEHLPELRTFVTDHDVL